MLLSFLLLIVGFAFLIKGADWLVNGSTSIARHYNVSELVIGLTIVAFGTSAPELVVSIISSTKGLNDVTLGNVVGSNLFNLLLILGVSGVIFPLVVQVKTVWKEIPFSLLAAILLFLLANYTFNSGEIRSIDRIDGIFLLFFFIIFLVYIFYNMKNNEEVLDAGFNEMKPVKSVLLIIVGLASLIISSRVVVDNAVKVASILGASEKIIGVTIVSAGTSLPELVTSVVAAFKRRSDLAIGNIIGSNIFNILLVLGVSSIIHPIEYNVSFNTDILLLIASTVLLFAFMFSGKRHKLDRWEAGLFIAAYLGYIYYLLR